MSEPFFFNSINIEFAFGGFLLKVTNISHGKPWLPIAMHSHGENAYELHCITGGKGTLRLEDKSYSLTANTLFMTGPHVRHEQQSDKDDPMSELCINFEVIAANEKTPSDTLTLQTLFTKTHFYFMNNASFIPALCSALEYEIEHQYVGYIENIKAELSKSVVLLVRTYCGSEKSVDALRTYGASDRRSRLIDEMFLYGYRTITLNTLSEALALSPRQCERVLERYFGLSFTQKRNEARMRAASMLLLTSDMPIEAIANEVGIGSLGYFGKVFYEYYAMNATAYRKKFKRTP